MSRAFGIDISKYQASADGKKRMNFEAIRSHSEKVTFIASRAGISWGYKDPQFNYHWEQSGLLGVGRIAYHVIYFGESAVAQMDSLFKMLERRSNFKHDRIALDLEVAGINTKSRITSTTLNCLEICKARTGRYPMVYSRANWVNTYLSIKDLPKLDWWLATYRKTAPAPFYTSEHPGPPFLPKGVDNYLIHQTGDKCKSIGAQSHFMDYNRWNGDVNSVLTYFSNPSAMPYVPPTDPVVFKVKVLVNALRKRSGPGTSHKVIGHLNLGEIVSVYQESNGWLKIDKNSEVWCSGAANYVMRVEDDQSDPNPDKPKQARCIVSALYKRQGPGPNYKILGNLIRNQVVTVYEERYNWFRISKEENIWVCGYPQYMQFI